MSEKPKGLSHFWNEVKRRNVLRSLAIYAGTAFIILEACSLIFPRWGLPDWSIDLVLYLLILGVFITIIVSWIFDITPQGMQKTKPLEEIQANEKPSDSKRWKAATYVSLVVIVALVIFNVINPVKTLRAGDIQSLLVLPFDNFTGDDQLDYVAAGMHSSLIGDMGQISGLRVISKTTANIYKSLGLSLSEMATELNTEAVVEPSVMCYGDSVCIHVRVITPFPEEKQIWIGEYKEEKSQILNLYNQVCKQIADEIKISLTPQEETALAQIRTVNTEAYDLYMRGMYYWDQLTPEALQMALEYFNQAIEVDPDWAPPYAGVALFWIGVRQMGLAPPSITVPNIYKHLNKIIALDPDAAITHFVSAGTAVWTGYEWEKGESEFLEVIKLNPNDADNRAYYAHLLLFLKRHNEALIQAQLALELDPLNPLIQGLVAVVYGHIGNVEQALELAKQIIQVVPNHPLALGTLWEGNYWIGNYEESFRYCGKLFNLGEENSELILDIYEEQGNIAAVEKVISIIEAIPDEQIPVSAAIRIAIMYLLVDRMEEALVILESILEEQGPDLPYATTGVKSFEKLENEPRFISILEKMGLPPPLPS